MDRSPTLALLRERIVAYAASRLRREEAEDLAQEVLVVLEEKYRHVEQAVDLLPLSFRILRFKMHALVRRTVRRGEHLQAAVDELPLADPSPDPEQETRRRESRERLAAALRRLDGRCREIFRLKLEGRTFPEIQGILKARSLNTVYTWDFRCRKRLLELMGGRWEAER